MSVGERIYDLRKANKMSRADLKEISGVSESTIKQYENNSRRPQAEKLQKIASAFGVSVDFLLGHETKRTIIPGRLDVKEVNNPESDFYEYTIESYDREAFEFGLKIFQDAGAMPEEAKKQITNFVDFMKSQYPST